MILQKVVFNNFRQYIGHQEIVFAFQKHKNVTIIHGENGFGKTCFLNGLLWGLYGKNGLTKKFSKPESIIPDSIRENSKKPTTDISSVELIFKHGDYEYYVKRSISLAQEKATHGEETDLELQITSLNSGGTAGSEKDSKAQKRINSILPADLRELIFFAGEQLDHLAMEANATQVRDSVRGLLGLKLISQAIEDLKSPSVRGKLKDELRRNSDNETTQLLEQQAKIELAISDKKKGLETCRSNQNALLKKMSDINAQLEANREARDLHKQRTNLETELADKNKTLQELEKRLGDLLAMDGYSLFCPDLVERGKSITQKLHAEGRIPARVMNEYIHDLLRAEICICGTRIPKDSEIWKKVEAQLTNAAHPEFNRAVGDLYKAMGVIEGSVNHTRESVNNMISLRLSLKEACLNIREDLDEIKDALEGKDNKEIHLLEAQREKEEINNRELLRLEGSLSTEIETAENEQRRLSVEIQSKQQKGEEGKKAQRRLHRLEKVIELLERILKTESDDLRNELCKEIEAIFRRISFHDYRLELTDEFTMRLSKTLPGSSGLVKVDVGASDGQRAVMSLVFIASLVALAQRRNEIPTIVKDLHGGDFPIVMDSPFAQMGEEFTAKIAKTVPELAPQAIVLVTARQYKGDVERELGLSKRIGKRYILNYHAPTKRDDASDSITLGNKKFKIFKKDEIEHTQIQEVEL